MKKKVITAFAIVAMIAAELNVSAAGLEDIFSAKFYTDRYQDVKQAYAEGNPYDHMLYWGLEEGRLISPVLDVVFYRENNPDLEAAFGEDWDAYVEHWFNHGIAEGRESGTDFDVKLYLEQYPDLQEVFGDNYAAAAKHYIEYGLEEGRSKGIRLPEVVEVNSVNVVVPEAGDDGQGSVSSGDSGTAGGEDYDYKDDGSYTIKEYDASQKVIKRTDYDSEGNCTGVKEYEYDSAGNRIKETHYDSDGNVIE